VFDCRTLAEPPEPVDLGRLAAGFVDPDEDRARQGGYLRWFPRAGVLLDLGCGSGAFLEVAARAGWAARGVDASAERVAACAARGLDARCAEAVEFLESGEELFGGILAAHLIEHLPPERAARLIVAAAGRLAPGGRLVLVTPDLRSAIVAAETFWLDPTHLRPYPRALVERLCAAAGLRKVASFGDPGSRPRRPAWKQALAALRSWLSGCDRSGPMDLVVVAERP
jgi:2-polyprenyl-3-methyl-5-hydroxy-6-metoxy-1,4-benzoquinol methylase